MNKITMAKLLIIVRLFAESLFFPFLGIFLASKGYTTSQIGIIMGIMPICAIVCAPIYSKVFNNPKRVKRALTIMSVIEASLIILFPTKRNLTAWLSVTIFPLKCLGNNTADYTRVLQNEDKARKKIFNYINWYFIKF